MVVLIKIKKWENVQKKMLIWQEKIDLSHLNKNKF